MRERREMVFEKKLLCAVTIAATLAGCAVGPNYQRPSVAVPQAFKEAGEWKAAEPTQPSGSWWERFDDAELNALQAELEASNQSLAASRAQYEQARALVRSARADFFPTITAQGSATRSASGSGAATTVTPTNNVPVARTQTIYGATVDVNWELDLWGRIRRSTESAKASAQASAADLAAARLSLQAEL